MESSTALHDINDSARAQCGEAGVPHEVVRPRYPQHKSYLKSIGAMTSANHSHKPVVLETGCCYGTHVRFIPAEGVPAYAITASDLHGGYWDIGRKLYNVPGAFQKLENRVVKVMTRFGSLAVHQKAYGLLDILSHGFVN
ncbi:hypothetical protein HK101_008020 [Irineochytrium annulatum]|nr:hypothetical protein HK101_008020 [Irineochytrium annulatum]